MNVFKPILEIICIPLVRQHSLDHQNSIYDHCLALRSRHLMGAFSYWLQIELRKCHYNMGNADSQDCFKMDGIASVSYYIIILYDIWCLTALRFTANYEVGICRSYCSFKFSFQQTDFDVSNIVFPVTKDRNHPYSICIINFWSHQPFPVNINCNFVCTCNVNKEQVFQMW